MYLEVKRTLFWHIRLVRTGNNEVLLNSETYYSKANAVREAKKLSKALNLKVRGAE